MRSSDIFPLYRSESAVKWAYTIVRLDCFASVYRGAMNRSTSHEKIKPLAVARIDEILDGAIWTHKIHEKQADWYMCIGRTLSTSSTILLALTGSGAIAAIANEGVWLKIFTAAVSATSLFITLWNRAFDFEGRAKEQRAAAKTFLEIRENGRELAFKISADCLSDDEILEAVDGFSEDYVHACIAAPSTTDHAVRRASRDLREGKASNE